MASVTTYELSLRPIPWKTTAAPIVQGSVGSFMVAAVASPPNITALLPVNSQFYLVPADSGTGEDPTIIRTCTSATFDATTNLNTFQFTPAPALTWTALAWVVVLDNLQEYPPVKTYVVVQTSPTPTINALNQAVNLVN